MRKQTKLLLLFALVLTMLLAFGIMASAAATTEGANDAYYKVTASDGSVIGYHSTLGTAVAAVTDNGVITVLKDVPAEAAGQNLERESVTYTITGGTGTGAGATRKTITFTGSGDYMLYWGKTAGDKKHNGNVTIENITFATTKTYTAMIYSTGYSWGAGTNVGTMTLRNFRSETKTSYGIWLHQSGHLVIEGEDTYLKNTSTVTGLTTSTKNNILRFNSGAGNSVITIKAGTLIGTLSVVTTCTLNFSDCTLIGGFANATNTGPTLNWDNVTMEGPFIFGKENTKVNISNSTLSNVSPYISGSDMFVMTTVPKSISLTDTTVNLAGEGVKLFSTDANADIVTISGLTANVSGGAVIPVSSDAASFTGTKLTITDYAAPYNLIYSGEHTVSSMADVVALIKAGGDYAAYDIADDRWQYVAMNNADLTVTLSGEAATTTVAFITCHAGNLVVDLPPYVVTDANGENATYYNTLQEAITAVTAGGTITLQRNVVGEAPGVAVNPNSVSYTLDGAGFTITFAAASVTEKIDLLTHVSTSTVSDIEFKNLTLALDDPEVIAQTVMKISGNSYADFAVSSLKLNNVVCEISSKYGFWIYATLEFTIDGENSVITNTAGNIWRTNASAGSSVITINAGTISGKDVVSGGSATTYLKGGSLTVTNAIEFGSTSATGYGNTVYMQGATVNGTVSFSNTSNLATNSDYKYNKFTMTSGTINGQIIVTANALKATINIEGGTLNNGTSSLLKLQADGVTVNVEGTASLTGSNIFWIVGAITADINIDGNDVALNPNSCLVYCDSFTGTATVDVTNMTTQHDLGSAKIVDVVNADGCTVDFTGGNFKTAAQYAFHVRREDVTLTIKDVTAKSVYAGTATNGMFYMNSSAPGSKIVVDGGNYDADKVMMFTYTTCTYEFKGNGSFKSGSYMFHFGAKHTTLNITNGTYETTGSSMFYSSGANSCTIKIEDGTFTGASNIMQIYSASDVTINDGEFYSNATSMLGTDAKHMFVFGAPGSSLTVTDGKFVGSAYNYSLIACNDSSAEGFRTINLLGGEFEGGAHQWLFINQGTQLTIDGATFTDKGTLNNEGAIRVRENGNANDVTVTIKSGTFNLHSEGCYAPLFWIEEKNVVIEGGTFNVYRLAHLEYVSDVSSLTVEGGLINVYGDKAVYLTNIGLVDDTAVASIYLNGGTFVMHNEEALAVVYGVTSNLVAFEVNGITVLTKNTYTAVYGNNTLENVVIGIGDKNALMVPANGPVVKYAGELYRTYVLAPATDAEKDVANSEGAFKGAAVEIGKNYDNSGIRFTTVLSAEVRAALQAIVDAGNSTLIFGTLIAPADYVAAAKAFTIEALDALVVDLAEGKQKYVAIEAKESPRYENETDVIPLSYSAAIVKLQEANFGRALAAISYVEIWDNTTHECVVYYGSFDSTVNARSMREIALASLADKGEELGNKLEGTLKYAGFTAEAPTAVNWNAGKIGTNGAITSAAGYYYSDLIYLEKAGTVVTFTDADGSFAGSDTLVVSRWNADGTALLNDHCSFAGGSADVTYSYGSTSYRYVSSFDGEYVRLCYTGSGDASVYTYETTEVGTLVSNLTLYNDYVRDVFFAESSADFYDEALSGLKMAAVGDSYFNDPNVMPNMWIELLAEKYGMDFDNHGISGSTMANHAKKGKNPMVDRVNGEGSKAFDQTVDPTVNVVFFDGGRNDLTAGIKLGDATIDNRDGATVLGAVNLIIEKLHTLYPNALIVCLNPWGVDRSYTLDYNDDGNKIKCTQNQYAAAIHAQHLLNAEKYPGYVLAYDLADKEATGVNMDSKLFTEYYTKTYTDISHLNSHGAMKFLPVIEKYLSEQYALFTK